MINGHLQHCWEFREVQAKKSVGDWWTAARLIELSRRKSKHHISNRTVLNCKINNCGTITVHSYTCWMSLLILRNAQVLTRGVNLFQSSLNTNLHGVAYQPWRVLFKSSRNMKRKATDAGTVSAAKRQREPQADYCDVETRKDDHGNTIWPASEDSVARARDFVKEWLVFLWTPWNRLSNSAAVLLPGARRSSSRTRTQMALMQA